ncbi:hypothetical protein ACIBCH_41800 [Amycolatopsis thailandensis]|uniref:hypothetical protein n=1 Tax=Amycolatopsis thailandensis TaxID=589330 RepID=UPI0037B1A118
MIMKTPTIPRTSRPRKLAGSDERPASSNTLEETSMFSEKGSALLGRTNNPSGLAGELPSYDELVAWQTAVDASDKQLTDLGVVWSRAHRGAFATVDEVGAALRRIVGVE